MKKIGKVTGGYENPKESSDGTIICSKCGKKLTKGTFAGPAKLYQCSNKACSLYGISFLKLGNGDWKTPN